MSSESETVVPKSQRNTPAYQVEEVSFKPRSESTTNAALQKKKIQDTINERAKFVKKEYENKTEPCYTLVWVRAMATHHPGPNIGRFKFNDIYNNYIEGMKYLVPMFVAQALEATNNAIILN